MMAATHRLGGIAAGTVTAALLQKSGMESGILIASAVLGSLIPAIDNRHSSISRKWPLVSLLVSAGQGIIRGISQIMPKKQKKYIRSLIGHRGLTHSFFPVIVLPVIVAMIGYGTGYGHTGYNVAVGLAVGILSHLVFDMLAGGVPLFMPFTTQRIIFGKIKTGGVVEWLFRVALILVFLYFGLEVIIPWQKLLRL